MWRAYDIADSGLYQEGQQGPGDVATIPDGLESNLLWSSPRLIMADEAVRCERMVHIPPGFLSC